MEPTTLDFIPKNRSFGMDSVIKKAISRRKTVNSFLSKKGFVDIGDKETYEKTNLQYKKKMRRT
jgi:mannose-1-phosphate guanylyltransferase